MIRAQLMEFMETTEWEDMNFGSEKGSLSACLYAKGQLGGCESDRSVEVMIRAQLIN
jgi:hypothetical protein